MNNQKYIQFFIFAFALFGFFISSCSEDDLSSTSIISEVGNPKSPFDEWLDLNFLNPYNLEYKYRMEDVEIDFSKNYAPPSMEYSMKLAKIIKHVWLDAYVEVGGDAFLSKCAPSILLLYGSGSWNTDGTMTLGTAEGGLKISIFLVNSLDPYNAELLNRYYLSTMHHEFTHILQQNVNYPQEYNLISAGDYLPSSWYNRSVAEYASLGFITSYAGSQPVEDITEVTARYITFTEAQWDELWKYADEEGTKKLQQKIAIMKQYMKEAWNIDMDVLKETVNRRMNEISYLMLLEDNWLPLIDHSQSVVESDQQTLLKQLRLEWPEAKKGITNHPNCCHVHDAALMNNLGINE